MNKRSPYACAIAMLASYALAMPNSMFPQSAQRAGEVSRVIPAVSIARSGKNITASPKSVVDWQDLVNTQANARARIALDDGSVLNVGSEASIRVVKHDAGAQQTELELTYGKLRTQAQKIAKPDGKFEVRTPAGVAGVVGTDFYIAFDNSTQSMNVVVFDGVVKVCNLQGVCVMVKAGQMSGVRGGDNSSPLPPTQAPLSVLTTATQETDNGGRLGEVIGQQAAHHIGKTTAITLGVLAAIPAVVVPVVVNHGGSAAPPPVNGCPRGNPQCG
jgi:hypothetical protein